MKKVSAATLAIIVVASAGAIPQSSVQLPAIQTVKDFDRPHKARIEELKPRWTQDCDQINSHACAEMKESACSSPYLQKPDCALEPGCAALQKGCHIIPILHLDSIQPRGDLKSPAQPAVQARNPESEQPCWLNENPEYDCLSFGVNNWNHSFGEDPRCLDSPRCLALREKIYNYRRDLEQAPTLASGALKHSPLRLPGPRTDNEEIEAAPSKHKEPILDSTDEYDFFNQQLVEYQYRLVCDDRWRKQSEDHWDIAETRCPLWQELLDRCAQR